MRPLLLLALAIASLSVSCKKDETPPPPPPPDPECRNGMLEEGEECDALPDNFPEGCNPNTCQVEVGFVCSPQPPDTSGGGTGGTFEPIEWMSSCEMLDTCGDGVLDPGEDCDDGDGNEQQGLGDGCSNCTVDPLWQCMTLPGMPSECWLCGDGFLDEAYEECDDGHEAEGIGLDTPGCSPLCTVEPGWECMQGVEQFTLCQPLCGDGIWLDDSVNGVNQASEEGCDDGNLLDGDGCDSSCNVEPGCDCSGLVMGMSTCTCDMGTSDGGTGSGSDSGGSSSGGSGSGSSSGN